MFGLSEFYTRILNKSLPTQCGISCEIVDPHIARLNRRLTESISCFSYTLVLKGRALITYDDRRTEIIQNDLIIYTPGMLMTTEEASEDFSALCLIADETTTYEIPYARNVIRASFFPVSAKTQNKLSLNDCESRWMENRMREILTYTSSDHIYKSECLRSLYSIFILDLLNVERRFCNPISNAGHSIDIFLRFMKLLTEHYTTHHDITFYADRLAVTPIYLSRIVKLFSRRTVKNHVDRLLIMEASYRLGSTDEPVADIASKLGFATPAGFCKFFKRSKGMSPREYRIGGFFNR